MIPGMMNDDEKKIAMVIVGKPEEKEPADLAGLDTCVEEMMQAFEAKDKKMLKDALKSFIYLMEDEEENSENNPEEY